MAKFNYDRITQTAAKLLKNASRGEIQYIPVIAGANAWDAKTEGTPIPLDGVAVGVSSYYVNDLITSSDIMVTFSPFGGQVEQSGLMSLDGERKQIIKVQKNLAAGDVITWRVFVKG